LRSVEDTKKLFGSKKNNPNQIFMLLNTWFAFVAILFISSHLPHWQNVSYHGWINEALYFLLFLLATFIFSREVHNRDIFINMSIFLFMHSFSFLNIFIGDKYLFGSNYTGYYFFLYKKMILCFLFNFAVIYIVFKYLFLGEKRWFLYTFTFAVLVPVSGIHLYPYIKNPSIIFSVGQKFSIDLYRRLLLTQSLSFFFILLYGYLLYKKDRIIGEYINPLMAFLFIFLVTDMVNKFSKVYQFQIYSISQYVLTINLVFLSIVLFKKLFFLSSEYGQFYEALINKGVKTGKIRVQRRHGELNALIIRFLKLYFYQRRNYLLVLSLLAFIGFGYFQLPKFFTINVTVFLLCFLILFWFISILYKKRAKRKYTLP